MKLWRWLLLPALAALALLLYGGGPTSVAAPPDDLPDFAPGELLVKVKPGAQPTNAAAASWRWAKRDAAFSAGDRQSGSSPVDTHPIQAHNRGGGQ